MHDIALNILLIDLTGVIIIITIAASLFIISEIRRMWKRK